MTSTLTPPMVHPWIEFACAKKVSNGAGHTVGDSKLPFAMRLVLAGVADAELVSINPNPPSDNATPHDKDAAASSDATAFVTAPNDFCHVLPAN
jgi:hypothetical protein